MENKLPAAPAAEEALARTNPKVVAVANRLGWQPETLLKRTERALSSPVEQQLYLAVAKDFGLQPESFATLLRIKLGNQQLQAADLEVRTIGKNLVSSKLSDVGDFLEDALGIVGKIQQDYAQFRLSMADAGRLALVFGDRTEEVLDSIVSQVEMLRQRMKINPRASQRQIFDSALRLLMKRITGHS